MTQTTAAKAHTDGGTYAVIAFAETRNGFGIAVTRWVTYRDQVVFEVNRVGSDGRMLRLKHFTTEPKAREFGNAMWRRDK